VSCVIIVTYERMKLLTAIVRLFGDSGIPDKGMPFYKVFYGAKGRPQGHCKAAITRSPSGNTALKQSRNKSSCGQKVVPSHYLIEGSRCSIFSNGAPPRDAKSPLPSARRHLLCAALIVVFRFRRPISCIRSFLLPPRPRLALASVGVTCDGCGSGAMFRKVWPTRMRTGIAARCLRLPSTERCVASASRLAERSTIMAGTLSQSSETTSASIWFASPIGRRLCGRRRTIPVPRLGPRNNLFS
jgi:hypothetical protein